MTTVQHFCDKCGVRITDERTELVVESGALADRFASIELCAWCTGIIAGWLNGSSLASSPTGPSPSTASSPLADRTRSVRLAREVAGASA